VHLLEHLKHVLLDLHAAWLMWLLIALSVASLCVIIERALYFHATHIDTERLSATLDAQLRAGQYRAALEAMGAVDAPQTAIVLAGLKHADMGATATSQAMDGATALQKKRMERGLNFLGTLGNNAPFVGLLGTVIGVIEAFEVLGKPDVGGGGLAPQNLMTGISEALVATAVGLFVAIPAVAAFNYFQGRIQSVLSDTDALSNILLAHLSAEVRRDDFEPSAQDASSQEEQS
jgi:biopolymer transport protein ExbB